MGKLFVITSGKGGTGKSTVTSGLGAALARRGKRVLLIDTDEGLRCLDLLLGVADSAVYDAGDLVSGRCSADAAVYPVGSCDGLFVLAAPVVPGQLRAREIFSGLCQKLAAVFDYVLIDSPAGIDEGFENACSCAGNAIVVVNSDAVSLRDAGVVNKLLKDRGIRHRRMIINRFLPSMILTGVSPNIDQIIDLAGVQLIGVVPSDDWVLTCAALGQAIATGKAAESFDRIAARLEGEPAALVVSVR